LVMRARSPFSTSRECPGLYRARPRPRARFDEGPILEKAALHRDGSSERMAAPVGVRLSETIDRNVALPSNPTDRPITDMEIGPSARLFEDSTSNLVRLTLVKETDTPDTTKGRR